MTKKKDIPIIQLKDIEKRFPGVKALDGVQLTVMPGEVHALMGENGAGKSTLIKVIAGVHKIDGGSYCIQGRPAGLAGPKDAREKGISVIYQELNMIDNLTVAENIFFGNYPVKGRGRVDWKRMEQSAREALMEIGVEIDPRMKVGYLPIAKQQLVEIAKALVMHPRLLIMDEPTSALSTAEIGKLFDVVRRLKAKNVAVIYVSHKLEEVYALADRITVMRDGKYIGTGSAEELDEQELIRMMVGHSVEGITRRQGARRGKVMLEVDHLSSDCVREASFTIHSGEIVGFAGLMGAGRSELARAVIGADRRLGGTVRIDGRELGPHDVRMALPEYRPPGPPLLGPHDVRMARKTGIGLVPENRKSEGIIAGKGVGFNIALSSLSQIKRGLKISRKMEREMVGRQIRELSIKTASQDTAVDTLSGGNQQKVLLGRWLAREDLKVLIVDEPTRGIDVGARAEIYGILGRLAEKGTAIMMISSELPEIINLCDRVYVMNAGRITGELDSSDLEITQEEVMRLAIKKAENAKQKQ